MTATSLSREPLRSGAGAAFTTGALVTLAFVVLGFLSILWTPYPSASFDVGAALQDPSGAHWLGTDPLGHDVLSLVMKSVLTSFVVSGIAVIIGAIIGIPLGVLASRWPRSGGLGDGVAGLAALFPPLIVAIVLATDFGPSAVISMVAIGVGAIVPFARATSRAVNGFSSRAYLDAAQLAGLTRWEAIRHHLLRQIIRPIVAEAFTLLGIAVVWETGLSYLGLGSQAPAASFGLILRDAQSYIAANPLLVVIPGLILVLMVAALALIARGISQQSIAEGSLGPA
jgi:peptide/nickel transport system permease protein